MARSVMSSQDKSYGHYAYYCAAPTGICDGGNFHKEEKQYLQCPCGFSVDQDR